jgi:hypothetical protein
MQVSKSPSNGLSRGALRGQWSLRKVVGKYAGGHATLHTRTLLGGAHSVLVRTRLHIVAGKTSVRRECFRDLSLLPLIHLLRLRCSSRPDTLRRFYRGCYLTGDKLTYPRPSRDLSQCLKPHRRASRASRSFNFDTRAQSFRDGAAASSMLSKQRAHGSIAMGNVQCPCRLHHRQCRLRSFNRVYWTSEETGSNTIAK